LPITPEPSALDGMRQRLEADGIQYLLVQFVDIHGSAKVKMVPASCLEDVTTAGAGFAGAAVWGMGHGPHSHDLMGRIDLDTYTRLPWEPGVARFAADIYVDGAPHPYCPRVNLKRVLAQLRDLGYIFNVGIEPEFFLVRRQADGSIVVADDDGVDTLSKACYDFKGFSQFMPFLRDLNDYFAALGWGNYQTDHEDANGQYEINYTYADALTGADRHTFTKMLTSQLGKKHGVIATHMAKPFGDLTGSGAHYHFSMKEIATGKNPFLAEGPDPKGLGQSEFAYHFIGGVLKHARALCAISSPTVNCYKRLQVGPALVGSRSGNTWTPAFITFGDNNRTMMLRTPAPGRFEDRTVSAAHNPYLTLAAYITAGLDGVNNKIDPGMPFIGTNLYEVPTEELRAKGIDILPQSQYEALEALKEDTVVQSALGPIADEFIRLKEGEWREYHRTVSQWEVERYLTLF
jgi:glutamine synthetase